MTVPDLGCGASQAAAHLARDHHAHVTALDSSAPQLRRAKERFADQGNLTFVHADAVEYLHRNPGVWDVVYSCWRNGFFGPASATRQPRPVSSATCSPSSASHRWPRGCAPSTTSQSNSSARWRVGSLDDVPALHLRPALRPRPVPQRLPAARPA
ncbi:methyltransferase domain-containing protein [Streptacidiphilus sp. MAP5-3]